MERYLSTGEEPIALPDPHWLPGTTHAIPDGMSPSLSPTLSDQPMTTRKGADFVLRAVKKAQLHTPPLWSPPHPCPQQLAPWHWHPDPLDSTFGFRPIDLHTGTEVPSLTVGKDAGSGKTERVGCISLDAPGPSGIAPAHPYPPVKRNRCIPSSSEDLA